jgi:dTDP-4-dehydrorhamnose reductase
MFVVVAGGSGQLGQALSNQLDLAGLNFIALDSKELDITDRNQVEKVIGELSPTVVINAAAWTDVDLAESDPEKAFRVNQYGVANLALASRLSRSVLVQVSTDYVFSGFSNSPIHEDSQVAPINVYGQSKAAGEREIAKHYSEGSYIVRTSWLYSEYGKNFVKTMCKIATDSQKSVKVITNQMGQPTNANELALQMIKLIQSSAIYGIYHGTNSGQTTWFDFAKEIFQMIGADPRRIIPVTSDKFPRPARRPENSVLGHGNWLREGLSPMDHWKISLEKSFEKILESIEMERRNGN